MMAHMGSCHATVLPRRDVPRGSSPHYPGTARIHAESISVAPQLRRWDSYFPTSLTHLELEMIPNLWA
jgi:hypothetical protein